MKIKIRRRSGSALIAAFLALQALPRQLHAGTYVWINSHGDGVWNENGNWNVPSGPLIPGGPAPQYIPSSADTARFDDTASAPGGTINLSANVDTVATLQFANTANTYTLTSQSGGGTLNVNAIDASQSSVTNTIDSTLALGETSLALGNTGQAIQITTGTGLLQIDAQITAPDGITVTAGTPGSGSVVLSNGNNFIGSFSGGTGKYLDIQSGATVVAHGDGSAGGANVLGGAPVLVRDGGTLQFSGNVQLNDPTFADNSASAAAVSTLANGNATVLAIGSGAGGDTVNLLTTSLGSIDANTGTAINGVTGTEHLVVGSEVFIEGSYSIQNLASLVNNGLIGSNVSGQTATIGTTGNTLPVTNNGTFEVDAGTMQVGNLTNLSGNILTGGDYSVFGTLQIMNAGQDIVTNRAAIQLYNGGQIQDANGNDAIGGHLVDNDGLLNFSSTNFTSSVAFTNTGAIYVEGTSTFTMTTITNGRGMSAPGLVPTLNVDSGAVNLSGTLSNKVDGVVNVTGGQLSAHQINNDGDVEFSGGSITGTVNNNGTFNVTQSGTHTVTGDFNNAGTVQVISITGQPATVLVVTGNYTGNAANLYLDPSSIEVHDFIQDATSSINAGAGSSIIVDHNFVDHSTSSQTDTSRATLEFTGNAAHVWDSANDHSFGVLQLDHSGTLTIAGINGETASIYIGELLLADGVSQLGSITTAINIEYDKNDPENAYLANSNGYTFSGGGQLEAVVTPEPASIALLSVAAVGLLRRQKRGSIRMA